MSCERAARALTRPARAAQFSIPVGGVCLGKVAGTLLELGEWAAYSVLSGRIKDAYKEANKNGDGILDYEDMRRAIMKAQGHEIDAKDFVAAVKENDKFETHEITPSNFTHIYLKVDKEEMQECRSTDRAKVCSLLVIAWLVLGMLYFTKSEGWSACPFHCAAAPCAAVRVLTRARLTHRSQRRVVLLWHRDADHHRLRRLCADHAVRAHAARAQAARPCRSL